MKTFLIWVIVCLFIVLLLVIGQHIHIKREIRQFTARVKRLKEEGYEQPVKVTTFDRDIVELANEINEHIDIQKRLGDEYRESSRRVNNVVSGISHDFRTPLTASLGYLQMIEKSGELSEKNMEYLLVAMDKNRYLKDLSDEFFELSKLENGCDEIECEDINLSNFISERLLEQYEWINACGLETSFDICDGTIINSSVHFLERITDNLFSNARKYAVTRLGISLTEDDKEVIFSISNDIGQEDEIDISRIFEPFYRAASRTKNGSGLGLYVVKCLCERLGAGLSASFDAGIFTVEIRFDKGK